MKPFQPRLAGAVRLLAALAIFLSPGHSVLAQADPQARYAAAISAADQKLKSGDFADALSAAQDAIDLDANRFEGDYYAAVVLLRQQLPDLAQSYADKALSLAPADHRQQAQLVVAAVAREKSVAQIASQADAAKDAQQWFSAAKLYLQAFEIQPSRSDLGLAAASLWTNLNEPAKAARIYRLLAAGADPAASADAAKKLQDLSQTLQGVWDASVASGWAHIQAAYLAPNASQGAFIAAAADFERATDAIPAAHGPSTANNAGAGAKEDTPYLGLAIAQAGLGRRDQVEAALKLGGQNGLRLDSSAYFAPSALSDARFGVLAGDLCTSDFRGFLETTFGPVASQSAADACASEPAAYVARGDAFLANAHFDSAVAAYDLALRSDAANVSALRGRSVAYRQLGQRDRQLADLTELLRLAPDSAWVLEQRAAAYRAESRFDLEAQDEDVLLRLTPDDEEIFAHACWTHLIIADDLQKALDDGAESVRLADMHGRDGYSASVCKAIVLLKQNQLDKTLAAFSALGPQGDPSDVALFDYALAVAKQKSGDGAGAAAAFADARHRDPGVDKTWSVYGIK